MAAHPGPRQRILHDLSSIGGRAAAVTMRPLGGAMGAAADAGIQLERRAVDRLLENGDLERLLESPRLHALAARVMSSAGAGRLVDTFFDSGLFDHLIDRLAASDALWRLVDEIAQSPSVTAAISQQGLGFADQVGNEVRLRSRRVDQRLEHAARRLIHRDPEAPPPGSDTPTP